MQKSYFKEGLGFLLVAVFTFGCASARVVKVQPGRGGVVEVSPAGSPEARAKAEAIMASNCKNGFEVVEEGEVVVGTVSETSTDNYESDKKKKKSFFEPSSSSKGTTTTRQQTEWHLTYQCK